MFAMQTIRLNASPFLSPRDLGIVSSILRRGDLVAIPTETVYGLAADVFQPDAIAKIFQAKKRPQDNPLIAHICSMDQLDLLSQDPHPLLLRLANQFWPGPLTLVFQRKKNVPAIASANLFTIAVRMPSHPSARQIIENYGSPLVAPSANLSGRPSPTSAMHVLEDFDGEIGAVVDGGLCDYGIESSVVGLMDGKFVLLRPGATSRASIENCLDQPLIDPSHRGPILSPGMKYRHYAPKARIVLLDSEKERDEYPLAYAPQDLCAQNLYAHLREADQMGYHEITITMNDQIRSDEALMNRLSRAAGKNHD